MPVISPASPSTIHKMPFYPYFMYSSDNVDNWPGAPEDEWPLVQDYKEQYLALWGVG